MKTGDIPAVVPASLEIAARPPVPTVDPVAPAEAGAVAASASSSDSFGGAPRGGPTMADVARLESIKQEGQQSRKNTAEAMAAQRIALSRLRIEALVLEAQMASATGDAERARAVARAVRTEASTIRNALRASLGTGNASVSSEASSAVTRAQAAAREAAAQEGQGAGLAPWQGAAESQRDRAAVENAPQGVPVSSLHRSAYEALRRAEEVLEELARGSWTRPVDRSIDDAERNLSDAGRVAALGLMNDGEEQHGTLWAGYNGLA